MPEPGNSRVVNTDTINSEAVTFENVDPVLVCSESVVSELGSTECEGHAEPSDFLAHSGRSGTEILPRAFPETELMASATSGPLEKFRSGVLLSASQSAAATLPFDSLFSTGCSCCATIHSTISKVQPVQPLAHPISPQPTPAASAGPAGDGPTVFFTAVSKPDSIVSLEPVIKNLIADEQEETVSFNTAPPPRRRRHPHRRHTTFPLTPLAFEELG